MWPGAAGTLYGGVDFSLPGNGGPECRDFLPPVQRASETLVLVAFSVGYLLWGFSRLTPPDSKTYIRKDRGGRRCLLVLLSLVFGAEIAYKFATRQLIYLLNPCHVITMLQIILLALPPSVYSTVLFRIHLSFLNGAVLAIVFPVTNTLLLPCESEVYWLQHCLMLVVPYYLLRLGGVYNIERLSDISWAVMSLGIQLLYNFIILQLTAMMTLANLNSILCPAISDPFYGRSYRIMAFIHQSLFIPLCCKLYCTLANFFITQFSPTAVKPHLSTDVTEATHLRQSTTLSCLACGQTLVAQTVATNGATSSTPPLRQLRQNKIQ